MSPNGSGLGPFLYVVLVNDLVDNGLLILKFMDDSTVLEVIDNPAEPKMQDAPDNVVKWTEENTTRINGTKRKEMIITFQKNPLPSLFKHKCHSDRKRKIFQITMINYL